MIDVRTFLNTDPPKIAEIWSSQSPNRGLAQPVTTSMLEQHVFAKPYFNPHSFFVAEEDHEVVGFVHAALPPNWPDDTTTPESNTEQASHGTTGIVSILMAANHGSGSEILPLLLQKAETYLRTQGATQVCFGGTWPAGPFYFGLFGGCRNIGVRASDVQLIDFLTSQGYQQGEQYAIYQRSLAGFRPGVSRELMLVRRKYTVAPMFDPPESNWSESCLFVQQQRTRFDLQEKSTSAVIASSTFVELDFFSSSWGVQACGLWDLCLPETENAETLGFYLLGEAMRQLHESGAAWMEFCLHPSDVIGLQLANRLEFDQADAAITLSKTLV
ncbi:MAG: hypothetical protein COA78_07495 [Blastopirellula sp.]|nr:MAG: hypothetical protein COA78_07495 [Blastopirellula sp.]